MRSNPFSFLKSKNHFFKASLLLLPFLLLFIIIFIYISALVYASKPAPPYEETLGIDDTDNQDKDSVSFRENYDKASSLYKEGDPNWQIVSSTGQGRIILMLLVYDNLDIKDPPEPIKNQNLAWFIDCNAISQAQLSLAPPWGQYPYGFWKCRIGLNEDYFDYERHSVILKLRFEGPIDELNVRYVTQEFDVKDYGWEKKIIWKEYENFANISAGIFFIDPDERRTVNIAISDSRTNDDLEFEKKPGDIAPEKGFIEHIGALLWPIPGNGRCFTTSLL